MVTRVFINVVYTPFPYNLSKIFKHLTLAVFLHFNIICMFAMHQNYKNPLEQVSAHVPVSVKFVTDKSGICGLQDIDQLSLTVLKH